MNLKTVALAGCPMLLLLGSAAASPGVNRKADSGEIVRVYGIQYASAGYLAYVINDVYGAGETLLSPEQVFGFRRSGRSDLADLADEGVITSDSPLGVKAVSNDDSNSLIVKASNEQQAQIAAFIAQVDHVDQPAEYPTVIPLEFVRAEDMAPVVQSILDGSVVLGRSAADSEEDGGMVVADDKTNSLVVVTDDDTLATVESVLGQLDCASVQILYCPGT